MKTNTLQSVIIGGLLLLSACGRQNATSSDLVNLDPSLINGSVGGNLNVPCTGSNCGGEDPTDPGSNDPAYMVNAQLKYDDTAKDLLYVTESEVITDSLLKVRVTPQAAGIVNIPGYSNFSAEYDCVAVTVSIDGTSVSKTTKTLSRTGNSTLCPGAPQSQVLDFSANLTVGHGPLKLKVSRPRYDFYCQYWWNLYNQALNVNACGWVGYSYYCGAQYASLYADGTIGQKSNVCPLRNVYKTHVVNVDLEIFTNTDTGNGGGI